MEFCILTHLPDTLPETAQKLSCNQNSINDQFEESSLNSVKQFFINSNLTPTNLETIVPSNLNEILSKFDTFSFLPYNNQLLPNALTQIATEFNKNPNLDLIIVDSIIVDSYCYPSFYHAALPFNSFTLKRAKWISRDNPPASYFFSSKFFKYFPHLINSTLNSPIQELLWLEEIIKSEEKIQILHLRKPLFTTSPLEYSSEEKNNLKQALENWDINFRSPNFSQLFLWKTLKLIQKSIMGAARWRRCGIDVYLPETNSRIHYRQVINGRCPIAF